MSWTVPAGYVSGTARLLAPRTVRTSTEPGRRGPVQAEALAQLPTFYAEDTPASANELWSRLHSDPLFAARPAGQLVMPLPALMRHRHTPQDDHAKFMMNVLGCLLWVMATC